ncbi:MAG: hypothetical protein U0736_01375 [Gemmataceae bacterium]
MLRMQRCLSALLEQGRVDEAAAVFREEQQQRPADRVTFGLARWRWRRARRLTPCRCWSRCATVSTRTPTGDGPAARGRSTGRPAAGGRGV